MKSANPIMIHSGAFLVLAALLALAAGCAARPILAPPRAVRVVVLDAAVPASHAEDPSEIVGWWLSATDIFRDPNDGMHWGNLLADSLAAQIPNVQVYSRQDQKIYMASKDSALKEKYPKLSEAERKQILQEQDPLDFGRSLGADFVIASRIDDSCLTHHRTVHWWTARAKIEVEAWDCAQEKIVWTWSENRRDQLSSVYRLMKGMASRCALSAGTSGAFAHTPAISAPPVQMP